jgi:hypothetical protein
MNQTLLSLDVRLSKLCAGSVGPGPRTRPLPLHVPGPIRGVAVRLRAPKSSKSHPRVPPGRLIDHSPHSAIKSFMTSGSLTLGGANADYGTATSWSTNTAALMMKCHNYTEICVHDASTRVAS